MGDVAEDPVLNVSERGDRAFIGKAEGHDLTHVVGRQRGRPVPGRRAGLSKDFLNKARAWELDRSASGLYRLLAGVQHHGRDARQHGGAAQAALQRAVNEYFMCEVGRLDYRWINRRDRLDQPQVRDVGGGLRVADWDAALDAAASALRGRRVHVLASPNASNEALFLAGELMRTSGGSGVFRVTTGDEAPLPGVPDLSLRAERAANGTGARVLGYRELDTTLAIAADDAVLVLDDTLDGDLPSGLLEAMTRGAALVHVGTTLPTSIASQVQVVLPITNHTEEEGTFTNLRGRVQRFLQSRTAPGLARPSWFVLADLTERVGVTSGFGMPAEVFAAIRSVHPSYSELTYAQLGLRGLPILDAEARGLAAPSKAGVA
jgi:NADH-quinone oxidoreductase subunit G